MSRLEISWSNKFNNLFFTKTSIFVQGNAWAITAAIRWFDSFKLNLLVQINSEFFHKNFSRKIFWKIKKMQKINWFIFISKGDLYDLENVLNKTANFNTRSHSPGHCSALIALRKGNNDLFGAHVTFNGYNAMNRVLKLYKFAYGIRREINSITFREKIKTFLPKINP